MSERSASARFTIGEWRVDPALHQISRNGDTVVVEPQVMEVLVYLAHHAGEVIGHNELIDKLWRGSIVTESAIYQKLAKLRHALHDDPYKPHYIETIPKGGYRLIVPVVRVESEESGRTQSRRGGRAFRAQPRHFVSMTSMLLATCFLVLSSSDVSTSSAQKIFSASQVASIAVLPFIDMSGSGDQDYLGDGIADEVLHTLSSIPDMRVVARTSSFALRDRAIDVRDIGEKLNVDAILKGSIRSFDYRIRITAQLIHAETGYHIWSQSYDQTLADVLAVQEEIAFSVAQTLRPGFRSPKQVMTTNAEAYDQYMLGRHQMNRRLSENLERALEHFDRTIELDPEFGLAYANLSWTYQLAVWYGPLEESEEQALKASETAALKAIQLDDSLAEAWASLFHVHNWKLVILERPKPTSTTANGSVDAKWFKELDNAKQAIFRAMELNPNSAFVNRAYAYYLARTDRTDDAFRQNQRVVELDPLSATARLNLFLDFAERGQFDKAENEIRIAAELEPGWFAPSNRGAEFFLQIGRLDEAIEWGQEAVRIDVPNAGPYWAWQIADAYLTLGDYPAAEAWMSRALQLNEPEWWIDLQRLQMYLAQQSDRDAHVLLQDWLGRIPEDSLCCHKTAMLRTVADALNFGALVEMFVGHDEHAADLYDSALSLPRGQRHYDNDTNNLFGHDVLVAWGYLPAVNRAHLYKQTGDIDEADRLLNQSLEYLDEFDTVGIRGFPGTYYFPGVHYLRASIRSLQGKEKDALAALRLAVDGGWNRAWYARRDPNMAGLQSDPEFRAILQDIEIRLVGMRERAQLANVARH